MSFVNRVTRQLVLYDFFMQFSLGLMSPIFAVFILDNIQGSTLQVIGLAATFYWVARVISTVPLSRLMDRLDGERDEFYFAVLGAFIAMSTPLFFLLAKEPWHIYLIQFIFGLANSMAVPAWRILFIDHLDKGRTGFAFSLDDVGVGIAIAASAYLGSWIADIFGFQLLFIIVTMIGYVGVIMLIPLNRDAKSRAELEKTKKIQDIQRKRKIHGIGKGIIRRLNGV